MLENKKTITSIVDNNKTKQDKLGLTKDENNLKDKEPEIPQEVLNRMKEVEEKDMKPNPKDIMTPAAAMLKEKVIQ